MVEAPNVGMKIYGCTMYFQVCSKSATQLPSDRHIGRYCACVGAESGIVHEKQKRKEVQTRGGIWFCQMGKIEDIKPYMDVTGAEYHSYPDRRADHE